MGGYDGEIRIKTSMELKQLDKDIKEAENMLREYEKESERLAKERAKNEAEIGAKQQEASQVEIKRNRIKDILDKRTQSGQSTDTGIYGDLKLEYAQLDETYKRLSGEIIELENKTGKAMDTNQNNIESTKEKIGELTNKYNQAKQELLQYNEQLEQQKKREQEVKDIKRSIDNIGNSVKRVTGQMIRWSLSLIGINGMMSLVSRSLTMLKNEDKQLGANLNYIGFALANAIKPLVEKIVNLVLKLMTYIGYIINILFGFNIFKNSGIKDYEKSLKNSSKSAKQIKKDLMIFDEVNKLSEDSSSGDSGFVAPSIDLSKLSEIETPKWLGDIIDKLPVIFDWLWKIIGVIKLMKTGLGFFKSLGIILIIDGVIKGLRDIKKFIEDPCWENFKNLIGDLAEIVGGFGLVLGSIPLILVGIELAFIRWYGEIVGIFERLIDWIQDKIPTSIRTPFQLGLAGALLVISGFVGVAKGLFKSFQGGIRDILKGILKIFNGDWKQGVLQVIQGILKMMLSPFLAIREGINAIIRGLNKIKIKVPTWVPKYGGEEWGFNVKEIPQIKIGAIKLRQGGIINNPGRGVALGNNIIGGEGRNAEAVLPLDDKTMDRLGQSIARHMTINSTIINQMNGRTLSREVKQIMSENNFANNL